MYDLLKCAITVYDRKPNETRKMDADIGNTGSWVCMDFFVCPILGFICEGNGEYYYDICY